jgi:hypothetical protein
VIGSVRGRYALMNRPELDAETATQWGATPSKLTRDSAE